MRKTKEEMHLECILNDPEKLQYSKELSETVTLKTQAEENLKSFQTQKKAEITGCDAKINLLANKINTGKEYRDVECEITYDFAKKEKTWCRLDTGEIVKIRQIPEEEMQEEMSVEK